MSSQQADSSGIRRQRHTDRQTDVVALSFFLASLCLGNASPARGLARGLAGWQAGRLAAPLLPSSPSRSICRPDSSPSLIPGLATGAKEESECFFASYNLENMSFHTVKETEKAHPYIGKAASKSECAIMPPRPCQAKVKIRNPEVNIRNVRPMHTACTTNLPTCSLSRIKHTSIAPSSACECM